MTSSGNGGGARRSFCRKQRSSSGHGASTAAAESGADMWGSPWSADERRRMRILRVCAENTYYGHWPRKSGWGIKGRGSGQCPKSLCEPERYPQNVDHRRAANSYRALLDRRYAFDFYQEVWIGQLRFVDRFTFCRRRAEIVRQQIGVFVELGRRRDESGRIDNVVDRRASGREAGAGVLADLLDLRPHVAFPDDLAVLVTRDLGADHQQTLSVAQGNQRRRRGGRAG